MKSELEDGGGERISRIFSVVCGQKANPNCPKPEKQTQIVPSQRKGMGERIHWLK